MEAVLYEEQTLTLTRTADICLAGLVRQSIVDGPGFRMTVFAQGCPHHCPGCHNPDSHSFGGGFIRSVDDILALYDRNPLLAGITLSGGEPFGQAGGMAVLAEAVRGRGGSVWCYSGYTFEELLAKAAVDQDVAWLCRRIDVLVDGRFEQRRRSLSLRFRGSANQRIIDMPRSLAEREAALVRLDD